MVRDLYRSVFRRIEGKGLGLGIFNRFHRLVWQGWLQPEFVEVHGSRLYLPKDDTGMSQVLQMGRIFEPALVERFGRVVRPGMVVVDIGANVGYYTLLASKLVGPSGKVVAIEPEAVNLHFLNKNVVANACPNVWIGPWAVGDAVGEATLHLSRSSRSGHSLLKEESGQDGSQRVGVAALDEVLPPLKPNVIKMDIEGGEIAALRGMRRILRDPALTAVFIECNRDWLGRQRVSVEEYLGPLREAGFRTDDIDGVNFYCSRPS